MLKYDLNMKLKVFVNLDYLFYYLLFISLIPQSLSAQYSYYFQNYSLSEYNAGNQNWDITKSNDGKLFVANNDGLLEFDGIKWNLWEMPNKTIIRSVLAHQKKIYVGSYEEFGFFYRDDKGDLIYNSLLNIHTKKEPQNDEEFWKIISFNKAIVFRSFSNLYIYEQEEITAHKLPSIIMSCDMVNEKLYVSTLDKGIFILENNSLIPFFNSEELSNTKIISITSKNNNQLLINTELKGSFILEKNKITSWQTEINPLLKTHQLNKFSQLPNGNMIFGTIKNGIYICDYSGSILFNINKETGLLNNTVLGQYVTDDNKLWLGMDNGIAYVDLNTPNYFYNDLSGKLGAVYDVINFKNTIYIGSNTGLYRLDTNDKLEFIEGSQGQVWSLEEINGELFCGHNNGTFLVHENKIEPISSITGGWVIKKVPEHKNTFIQGTYAGLASFKKINEEWEVKHLGKTTIPIRFLVFEDEYTAWIAHVNKGLYRVKFEKDYSSIKEIEDYNKKGLWSDYYVKIYKLKNTIAFHTINGWQKYEPLIDSIIPYDLLNEKITKNSYIISEDNLSKIAFISNNILNFSSLLNNNSNFYIPSKYYNKRLITGNENISKINDSTYALNLYDGFMFIRLSDFNENGLLEKPKVEKIIINDQAIALNTSKIILPFSNNTIKILVTSVLCKEHTFEYKLSNSTINAPWTINKTGIIEFSNLADDNYSLSVRTIDNNQNTSEILPIEFTVLSPWYKNTFGFVLYTFILLLTGLIIYLMYKRKIKKEQKILQIKYEESQKRLLDKQTQENEKEKIRLKNESLENKVKLKSKQLANTAMALIKKNETLLLLKDELLTNKNNFDNKFSFKKLIKQIDSSIEHNDEWEIFEHNFNQVHETFFNKLKSNFPELTLKDLKICAYLRMNLSTKEIVPLLNISTRGIETIRYRLKRKLGLEKQDSLRGFLQNY